MDEDDKKTEKQKTKEEYKLAKNAYVRIRREEEKRYEKDIVDQV